MSWVTFPQKVQEVGEAPKDGKKYVRKNGEWQPLPVDIADGKKLVVDPDGQVYSDAEE